MEQWQREPKQRLEARLDRIDVRAFFVFYCSNIPQPTNQYTPRYEKILDENTHVARTPIHGQAYAETEIESKNGYSE